MGERLDQESKMVTRPQSIEAIDTRENCGEVLAPVLGMMVQPCACYPANRPSKLKLQDQV